MVFTSLVNRLQKARMKNRRVKTEAANNHKKHWPDQVHFVCRLRVNQVA